MPKKKLAADALHRQLDGLSSDRLEVHIASPVDNDTFLKQFTTSAKRCRTHDNCVLVTFRSRP
jgi:hypothetical protein